MSVQSPSPEAHITDSTAGESLAQTAEIIVDHVKDLAADVQEQASSIAPAHGGADDSSEQVTGSSEDGADGVVATGSVEVEAPSPPEPKTRPEPPAFQEDDVLGVSSSSPFFPSRA